MAGTKVEEAYTERDQKVNAKGEVVEIEIPYIVTGAADEDAALAAARSKAASQTVKGMELDSVEVTERINGDTWKVKKGVGWARNRHSVDFVPNPHFAQPAFTNKHKGKHTMEKVINLFYGRPETYRATSDVVADDVVMHRGRAAVVASDAIKTGEEGEVYVQGPHFVFDKIRFNIEEGAGVYFDFTTRNFVPEGTPGATRIGVADLPCDPKNSVLAFTING